MATYWENSCSFGLRYVSWYKCLTVSLVFSHLGFWSGNLFLIAPFPDLLCTFSLACEFLATVLRILSRTFARHSCECRASVVRIFLCRELIAKLFNMLKNFMRFFLPNISQDCRATVVRWSRDVRASVANLSPRNFGEFTMRNFCVLVRMSRKCRTTVARQSCENLATIWRENKTKRHSYECRATVVRI